MPSEAHYLTTSNGSNWRWKITVLFIATARGDLEETREVMSGMSRRGHPSTLDVSDKWSPRPLCGAGSRFATQHRVLGLKLSFNTIKSGLIPDGARSDISVLLFTL